MNDQAILHRATTGSWLASVLWLAAALAGCFSVLALNGKPLFYLDIWLYIEQGTTALQLVGLVDPAPVAQSAGPVSEPGAAATTAAATVNGSRSVVYAILTGLAVHFGSLGWIVVMNALVVFLAVYLPMRVAARKYLPDQSVARLVAVPILAACLTSLPFYVAYLMPDIFSPVLLLVISTITVFAHDMRAWECLLALALGSLAIVSHLSHLAIAGVMLPLIVLVALLISRRGWWLPTLLVLALLFVGYAENKLFKVAAKTLAHSEVILSPILTARMLQDGPGMEYLNRHCPDAAIDTCLLWAELQKSSDPYRITASHILFETSERLGSLKRMPTDQQQKVARAQFGFFFDVLREAPAGVIYHVLKNTLIQTSMARVDMTLPNAKVIASLRGVPGEQEFTDGRITADRDWLSVVTPFHYAVYLAALLVVVVLWLLPNRVPRPLKLFALILVAGVLANALVCGAVSQPATRYGARVSWLLPLVASIMVLFARPTRHEEA